MTVAGRLAASLLAPLFWTFAALAMPVPERAGDWWRIASDAPDVSPFRITEDGSSNVCDFTIWKDAAGKWHLVACVRGTDAPGQRVFHHWESDALEKTDWTPKGLFEVKRGERGTPPAPTSVQAPHAFPFAGKYYFFYNSGGAAYCMVSPDGANWSQHRASDGKEEFFPMGRDVCVFRDDPGARWIAYYCGDLKLPDTPHGAAMAARTAGALEGPWSSEQLVVRRQGNPESPFVLRRDGRYYLWQQMAVYESADPLSFEGPIVAHMTGLWFGGKYAPEVLSDAGQEYLAGYGNGIWLSKMKWVERAEEEIAKWREGWLDYLEKERLKREK